MKGLAPVDGVAPIRCGGIALVGWTIDADVIRTRSVLVDELISKGVDEAHIGVGYPVNFLGLDIAVPVFFHGEADGVCLEIEEGVMLQITVGHGDGLILLLVEGVVLFVSFCLHDDGYSRVHIYVLIGKCKIEVVFRVLVCIERFRSLYFLDLTGTTELDRHPDRDLVC